MKFISFSSIFFFALFLSACIPPNTIKNVDQNKSSEEPKSSGNIAGDFFFYPSTIRPVVPYYKYSCEPTPIGRGVDDGFFSLEVYNDRLYSGGFGYANHFNPSVRTPMLFSFPAWQVASPGLATTESVCEMREFRGMLYANTEQGGKIYRTADGKNWQEVFQNGSVGCVLRQYGEYLYATIHNGALGRGGKIFRSKSGNIGSWQKVFDDTGTQTDHMMKELIVFNGTLYALSVNRINSIGGYFTTKTGNLGDWKWHRVYDNEKSIRLFKGLVRTTLPNKGLWMTSTAAYSGGSDSAVWLGTQANASYPHLTLKKIKSFPGNSHLGELLEHEGNLFVTVTKEWKGRTGGASVWMLPAGDIAGTSWKQICYFPRETESWNLAVYRGMLYVTTKQDQHEGYNGSRGNVYRIKKTLTYK